jgi:PncC family amidohydrolase
MPEATIDHSPAGLQPVVQQSPQQPAGERPTQQPAGESPADPLDLDDLHPETVAADVRAHAMGSGQIVAVAESLTGGALSEALAKAGDASDWFAGGVVAYRNATKYRVLAVPEGPVVTPEAARAMALGVLELTGADVAVAVTGVGGPGNEEGKPAGTVFMCAVSRNEARDFAHVFEGSPEEVVAASVVHALRHLSGLLLESP